MVARLRGHDRFFCHVQRAFRLKLNDPQGRNRLTQDCKALLFGLHRYNELAAKNNEHPYCFLKSFVGDGSGAELGYDWAYSYYLKSFRPEITLMTEIALLHTVYHCMTQSEQTKTNQVFDAYKKFLLKNAKLKTHRYPYFSETTQGKEVIQWIQELKESFQNRDRIKKNKESNITTEQFLDYATIGLKKMMAFDAHFKFENSALLQTLSQFVEPNSLNACRAANARGQLMNGRLNRLYSAIFRANDGWQVKQIASEKSPLEFKEKALEAYKEQYIAHFKQLYYVNCNGNIAKTTNEMRSAELAELNGIFPDTLMDAIDEKYKRDEFVIKQTLYNLASTEPDKFKHNLAALDEAIDRFNNKATKQISVISLADSKITHQKLLRARRWSKIIEDKIVVTETKLPEEAVVVVKTKAPSGFTSILFELVST